MTKLYLAAYNLIVAYFWALVLRTTYLSYTAGDAPEEYWVRVGPTLKIAQTAAFMEVLHSAFGLVRSPLMTTIMQVSSRLLLLWCYTDRVEDAQAHWSIFLMVGSWALVEVPRYLFYFANLFMAKVPLPLFFLRYNLFMVLYPSGISGELLQIWTSLPHLYNTCMVCYKLSLTVLAIYAPAGPFMIMAMFQQRTRATKRRAQDSGSAKTPEGLVFPPGKRGDRSTTAAGKHIFAASVRNFDAEAAEAVEREKNWRFGYVKHVIRNVECSLASERAALRIAEDGLNAASESFEFIREGRTMSFATAMSTIDDTFETGFVKGTKPKPSGTKLEIPYKNRKLSGDELKAQLDAWVEYGTIEPSCRDAIWRVAQNPGWLDLSDRYFVLLGAGSAMGPLLVLLALGANIIAVDLDRPGIWKRLIGLARDSPGTMTFPLKEKRQDQCTTDDELFAAAGCNLFTQAPEIKNWVSTVCPGKPLTIGGYAYLDGALHVQVSLAMVAIMDGVRKARSNVSLGFLCSPTDVFVNPADAVAAIKTNSANVPLWQRLVQVLSCGKFLKSNLREPVHRFTVVNGIVVPQGPNYALAKRLQHWLAILARKQGHVVSSNVAPSTATASVVHNAQFAAAYGGFHLFKPMEVFYQETSNAVMGALLIHDVTNPTSVAHPDHPLDNPLLLFSSGSFHGGIWRNAFTIGSIGEVAATAFYLKKFALHLVAGSACFAAYMSWLMQK